MKNQLNRIILLGGSAGGLEAANKILTQLDADLPAAVFVILHLGSSPSPSIEASLTTAGALTGAFAKAGEPIEAGRIYMAPPDHHMLIQRDNVHLTRGPRVNRSRPAIDLAFRSSAVAYGTQAIGVILSGMLDDGTAGLHAIQRCGGMTIVQDPADALCADMPENALENVDANYVLPISKIGQKLNELARLPVDDKVTPPKDIVLENQFDLNTKDDLPRINQLGKQVPMGCPECGGPLWEIEHGNPLRYRCHLGHGLSVKNLMTQQDEQIEHTLWISLRALEEKARMQESLAQRQENAGRKKSVPLFQERAKETQAHVDRLRDLLLKMGGSGEALLENTQPTSSDN